MGSGHILVYAFDVLMQIYESYGYTQRDAARSILQNNIFGLDIDERAYQLAYFAVMMKARQYNRRILSENIEPNLCYLKNSKTIEQAVLDRLGELKKTASILIDENRYAEEYGSVLNISVPYCDLLALEEKLEEISNKDDYSNLMDIMEKEQLVSILSPIVQQSKILAQKYEVAVTNPPYMPVSNAGSKLSDYVKANYPDSKTDLFAVFIERCKQMLVKNGYQAMITMHSWMFISSYERLREKIIRNDIVNMVHLGARAFDEIAGEVVQTTAFVTRNNSIDSYKGIYCRLIEPNSENTKKEAFLSKEKRYSFNQSDYSKIPGKPISYWVNKQMIKAFDNHPSLGQKVLARNGMKTGDNGKYVRLWWEISKCAFSSDSRNVQEAVSSNAKWFPYNKGGEYRKWYGNNDCVVNWENEGASVIGNAKIEKRNVQDYPNKLKFMPSATWSLITSNPAFRFKNCNISDIAGMSFYPYDDNLYYYLGFCNTLLQMKY